MGSVLERAPSASPFMVQSLSRREVSLHRVKMAIVAIKRSMQKVDGKAQLPTNTIDSFGTHADEASKLPVAAARHPLCIQVTSTRQAKSRVVVHLSERGVDVDDSKTPQLKRPEGDVATLDLFRDSLFVMDSLISGTVDHAELRRRMLAARRVGFDCERFLFAFQLSMHATQSPSPRVAVRIRSEEQLVSFCTAKAMLDAMYPTQQVDEASFVAVVDDAASAEQVLDHLQSKVQSALGKGLTHLMLAEFATCL